MSDEQEIRVLSGEPTDEETAAIAAVFTSLLLERAVSNAALPDEAPASEWQRRARAVHRAPARGRRWNDL